MTHILITDLREIRYMAYVPEECKREDWLYEEYWLRALDIYQSALEKAKRESLPFDREEDRETVLELIIDQKPKNWDLTEVEPGIYQVPVEVEIAYYLPWRNEFVTTKDCVFNKSEATKVVARIVQPKEPKPIDVDTLLAVKEALGEPGMNEIKIVENSLMPDNLIVVSTKIFNQLKKSQGKEVNQ